MDLKSYIKSLPDEEARAAFAADCEATLGHLRNVMYGVRPCAPELAVAIEQKSAGAVTRRDVCPENWRRIWPELIEAGDDPSAAKAATANEG